MKVRQLWWCITLLSILILGVGLPRSTYATSYYVSPSGNDSNPGSQSLPWRTIYKASQTLVAGDTAFILSGTYKERVVPKNSGNSGNYITYSAYAGATVTIDGIGVSVPSWGGLFDVSGRSYIRVTGLRITNSSSAGILADTTSYVILDKNYTYNTVSSGIGVWNSNNTIVDSNEIVLACNDGNQEELTIATTNTFEVKGNHVHDGGPGNNGGEGIDVKDGSSNGTVHHNVVDHLNRVGIYVDAWDKHTFGIDVYSNLVHDCEEGYDVASEAGGLLENVRIFNNIAYNNVNVGITVAEWGLDVPHHPMNGITIINNTFYKNGVTWGGAIRVSNPEALNVVLRNNICSQNLSFQIEKESIVPSANLVVDHNLIDGFRNYPGEITGSSYVTGNPLFVNSSAADFHLQSNSPAIDKASSLNAPAQDYDSISRPQGAGFDIGAFEFGNPLPDYTIACSLSSITVLQGGSGNSNCTLTSVNGFSAPVTLGCTGLPAGATCAFSPNPANVPAGGTLASTLTVTASSAAVGAYTFQVASSSGSLSHNAPMSLAVTAPSSTLFFDDFQNGLNGWSVVKGSWSVSAGNLIGTTAGKLAEIHAPLPWPSSGASGCGNCAIDTYIQILTTKGRASVLGWYQDSKNYAELRLSDDSNQILLSQLSNGSTVASKTISYSVNPNTDYHVQLSYGNGQFLVVVDGVQVMSLSTGKAPFGNVGFMVRSQNNSAVRTSFREIRVTQ